MQRCVRGALAALALMVSGGIASAHPHVFVTAKSQLIYAPDGTLTGVRHAWTFDDMFSTYALQGVPSKTKGVYTREELTSLAQTNVESLAEYDFFTYARAGGKKSNFGKPADYYLEYDGAALVLHFTLPLKTPVKAQQLALEIFDPSYFVAFSLADDRPIELIGAPAACRLDIQRPKDGRAAAQTFDESTFTDGANANYGALFANKITVDCP